MTFELPELPYAKDALSPYISEETIEFHYGKHHRAYVTNLNKLTEGTEWADASLEDIILKSDGGIFNNAAQVWNHTFYWEGMAPNAGGEPTGELSQMIQDTFGSFSEFKQQFTQAGMTRFGSGWAWLVQTSDGKLAITSTANADNPLTQGLKPLLTCDVWEHAYYIDTRNDRAKHLSNFWELVNWNFVASQLQ